MYSQSQRPDVCAYLLKVCEECQHHLLDPQGITCLFDVDSGALSQRQCQVIGEVVEGLIHDICERDAVDAAGGKITVALHHRDDLWVLAIRDEGVRPPEKIASVSSALQDMALPLRGSWHAQSMADGAITAVMFAAKSSDNDDDIQTIDVSVPAGVEMMIPVGTDTIRLPRPQLH